MGHRIEDNCVCCDIPCINCGRKHEEVWFCDNCEEYADWQNPLYAFEGQELCLECIKERLNSKICDDMDEELCNECRRESEILYQYDSEWLCETCLEQHLEKVEVG